MRKANVLMNGKIAGCLSETEDGYVFLYDANYLKEQDAEAVGLTLSLTDIPYISKRMFPFFDGLIPEGWLLELAEHNWKLNARDRMGLLLACCKDCIGAVSIIETENQLATCNVYFVTKNRIKISLIFIRHVAVKFLVVRSQPYFHIQPNRCWNWMSR